MSSRHYRGYSLHDDVQEPAMRTWNRCQTAINIRNDLSMGCAEVYLGMLDELAKQQVAAMYTVIHLKGEDYVRRQVFKGAI